MRLIFSIAQAIGSYCVLNPDILSEYPHVGQACVRRYQAAQHPTKLAGHRKVRITLRINSINNSLAEMGIILLATRAQRMLVGGVVYSE